MRVAIPVSILLVLLTVASACGSTVETLPTNTPNISPVIPTATATRTPVFIADDAFDSCDLVEEFDRPATGGQMSFVLISGTAYDIVGGPPPPTSFPGYSRQELESRQSDYRLRLSFLAGYPNQDTGIRIERVSPDRMPKCLIDQFGDGPVWRIDPVDRSLIWGVNINVQAVNTELNPGEMREAFRLMLLTEEAQVRDITTDWCCPAGDGLILGTESRLGFVMLASR